MLSIYPPPGDSLPPKGLENGEPISTFNRSDWHRTPEEIYQYELRQKDAELVRLRSDINLLKAAPVLKASPLDTMSDSAIAETTAAETPVVSTRRSRNLTKLLRLQSQIAAISASQVSLAAAYTEQSKRVKTLEREIEKIIESHASKASKAKRSGGGLAKPTQISDAMADFLGVERGSMVARTYFTRAFASYVREQKLSDPNNKSVILIDDKIRSLITDADKNATITHMSIQRYVRHHFISTPADVTTSA